MKAPNYPPASAYEPPVVVPYRLTIEQCSIAELAANTNAWSIILKHIPMLKYVLQSPEAKSQLGNMTVLDYQVFTNRSLDPSVLEAIDKELGNLPIVGGSPL